MTERLASSRPPGKSGCARLGCCSLARGRFPTFTDSRSCRTTRTFGSSEVGRPVASHTILRSSSVRLEEAATEGVSQFVQATSVLNLAQINESPIAKVVLAISSIEALAVQGEGWTASQREMIDQATNWVHSEFGDSDAVHEVTDAIQRMHQHSLRQQAKRLLSKHDLLTWWSDWEDVYGRRSRLVPRWCEPRGRGCSRARARRDEGVRRDCALDCETAGGGAADCGAGAFEVR